MNLKQQIKQARANCNAQAFGTEAFDKAFDAVKALVQQEADSAPKFEYTSIDGDIWLPK